MARERQAQIGGTKETDMENGQYQEQEHDTDQLRLAKLGAFGILVESLRCYFNHARYFSRVLFTLGIPFFLYIIVVSILNSDLRLRPQPMSSQVTTQSHPQHLFSPPTAIVASATANSDELTDPIIRLWTALFVQKNSEVWLHIFKTAIPIWGFLIGISVLNQLCKALSDSGTISTVGLIYSRASQLRKNSVFPFLEHVLHKAPRLLYRVMRTWLWTLLFLTILCIITVLSQALVVLIGLSLEWTLLLVFILLLSFLTCLVVIGTLADVAESVTILDQEESSYGLEAYKKALALLNGKRMVAFRIFILWFLILAAINFIQPAPFTTNPWNPIRIMIIGMTCVVMWVVFQARGISVGVLYVSLKAFHGESTAGLETEEKTKGMSISDASCAADAAGAYGLAEKKGPGTDHRYSLLPV